MSGAEEPAYVARARALINEKQVTEAAGELLAGLRKDGDCAEAKILLEEIFDGHTTSELLRKEKRAAPADSADVPGGNEAAAVGGMVTFEMTPEAEAEHEWWIYWFTFVGASLLGVLLLAGTFCSVAVSPALINGALPLCGFASFVVTMTLCCRIHSRHERYQPDVVIPIISELGIMEPGTLVYQVGFTLVGVLLGGSIYRFQETVVPLLLSDSCMPPDQSSGAARSKLAAEVHSAVRAGYASAFGAALQGVFTLDLQPSLKVMLHFGGAMIFMWGGMTHAQTIEPVYAAAATAEGCMLFSHAPVVAAAAFRRVAITGALPVVGFVLPLGFQVVQFVYGGSSEDTAQESEKAVSSGEASGKQEDETDKEGKGQVAKQKQKEDAAGPQENSAAVSNAMGAMQWAIVVLFAAFYGSYGPDLYYAAPALGGAEGSDGQELGGVSPLALAVGSLVTVVTGLAFYYTEHMMD